jgi:hypothetical protein
MFDPDPDPEKTFEKHQTLKLMTLTLKFYKSGVYKRLRGIMGTATIL